MYTLIRYSSSGNMYIVETIAGNSKQQCTVIHRTHIANDYYSYSIGVRVSLIRGIVIAESENKEELLGIAALQVL